MYNLQEIMPIKLIIIRISEKWISRQTIAVNNPHIKAPRSDNVLDLFSHIAGHI